MRALSGHIRAAIEVDLLAAAGRLAPEGGVSPSLYELARETGHPVNRVRRVRDGLFKRGAWRWVIQRQGLVNKGQASRKEWIPTLEEIRAACAVELARRTGREYVPPVEIRECRAPRFA